MHNSGNPDSQNRFRALVPNQGPGQENFNALKRPRTEGNNIPYQHILKDTGRPPNTGSWVEVIQKNTSVSNPNTNNWFGLVPKQETEAWTKLVNPDQNTETHGAGQSR
jgi:hypothetical protein